MKVLDDQKVPDSAKVKQAVSLIFKILHIIDSRIPDVLLHAIGPTMYQRQKSLEICVEIHRSICFLLNRNW